MLSVAGSGTPDVDVSWPEGSSVQDVALTSFAEDIIVTLQERGYCRVALPEAPEGPVEASLRLRSTLSSSFLPLPDAFAEAYLGTDTGSDVASLEGSDIDDPSLALYMEQMNNVVGMLAPWIPATLEFAPVLGCAKPMLRKSRAEGTEGDAALAINTLLSQDAVAQGTVEEFLKWSTRRRIGLLYFIDVYGSVLLKAKTQAASLAGEEVQLDVAPASLLLFRHDVFVHSYKPRASDLILQAWLLEESPELQFLNVVGGHDQEIHALNGLGDVPEVKWPLYCTATALRGGGSCYSAEHLWLALATCTDTLVHAPLSRWSWDEFEAVAAIDSWGLAKHAGFVDDDVIHSFDPKFFGIDEEVAPTCHPHTRMTLEVGYETLVNAGFHRETLKGERINVYVADCSPDQDFTGFLPWHPESWSGSDRMMNSARLSYIFGLVGENTVIDTACSSANVAVNRCHQALVHQKGAFSATECPRYGLVLGCQAYTTGGSFVGLSMAHMLSSKGRSRSFDKSASGYARGEGTPSLFFRTPDAKPPEEEDSVRATVLSSAVNQDGRSASLTAPNGPSQTAVIQYCMNAGGLGPNSVIKFECHGTGTALGDPIEVSSCRTVMKKRNLPLVQCSGKSNHGHYEQGAGAMGFLKTIFEGLHWASGANCHLHTLNPNMDITGYPILHPVEPCPLDGPGPGVLTGVSSFGFGGTNSHVNWFATTRRFEMHRPPPRQLEKLDYITVQCATCKGRMCYLCGVSIPKYAPQQKHICSAVREETSSIQECSKCYRGRYKLKGVEYAEEMDPGLPIFIRGSWSGFKSLEEMEWVPSLTSGHYEHSIVLGSTRMEQFQLLVDGDPSLALYPIETSSSQEVYIEGPDAEEEGKVWLLDGTADEAPAGARYNLRFTWTRAKKKLEWKLAPAMIKA